jgi:Ca2+-binding RTX toxin-like protein
VTVSGLQLRLPVLEAPGPGAGPVQTPAPEILPPGYEPGVDYPNAVDAGDGSGGDGTGSPGACATTPIAGSRKADKLRGTAGSDVIRGKRGDDRLNGKRGDDCLYGGRGNDTLKGGPGTDTLSCGAGHNDRARADKADKVRGCEHVKRR